MSQFFVVPYSFIPGHHHNSKTIHQISAEHCAQLCVHDADIVCRSFDYYVSVTVVVVVVVVVLVVVVVVVVVVFVVTRCLSLLRLPQSVTFLHLSYSSSLFRLTSTCSTCCGWPLRWMAHDPSSPPTFLVPETCVQVLHTRHEKLAPETWRLQFRRFTSMMYRVYANLGGQ